MGALARARGAYGSSRDVPVALEVLRDATDCEDDDFGYAWSDVLCRHVLHEGEVFPVTARVVPFVVDVVDRSPALRRDRAMRAEIALFPAMAAAGARHADARVGAAVHAAIVDAARPIARWTRRETLRDAGLAALLATPALVEHALASHRPAELVRATLVHASLVTPEARAWTAVRLARVDHDVVQRALVELATERIAPYVEYRLAALAEALHARRRAAALDALRERFGTGQRPERVSTRGGAT